MMCCTGQCTGSQFTGTAINPARALGPAIVFHCHWNTVWLYLIAGEVFPTFRQKCCKLMVKLIFGLQNAPVCIPLQSILSALVGPHVAGSQVILLHLLLAINTIHTMISFEPAL